MASKSRLANFVGVTCEDLISVFILFFFFFFLFLLGEVWSGNCHLLLLGFLHFFNLNKFHICVCWNFGVFLLAIHNWISLLFSSRFYTIVLVQAYYYTSSVSAVLALIFVWVWLCNDSGRLIWRKSCFLWLRSVYLIGCNYCILFILSCNVCSIKCIIDLVFSLWIW